MTMSTSVDVPFFKTLVASSVVAIVLGSCDYNPAPDFIPSLHPDVVGRMDFSEEVATLPATVSYKRSWCLESKPCKKMSEALVYEARGEGRRGMVAVATVIKNRAEGENRFPDTITGVIEQRAQFSYLKDMHKQKKPTNSDWNIAYNVSYDVLNNEVKSEVGSATHYHANYVSPRWSKHLGYVASVGNHKFYLE